MKFYNNFLNKFGFARDTANEEIATSEVKAGESVKKTEEVTIRVEEAATKSPEETRVKEAKAKAVIEAEEAKAKAAKKASKATKKATKIVRQEKIKAFVDNYVGVVKEAFEVYRQELKVEKAKAMSAISGQSEDISKKLKENLKLEETLLEHKKKKAQQVSERAKKSALEADLPKEVIEASFALIDAKVDAVKKYLTHVRAEEIQDFVNKVSAAPDLGTVVFKNEMKASANKKRANQEDEYQSQSFRKKVSQAGLKQEVAESFEEVINAEIGKHGNNILSTENAEIAQMLHTALQSLASDRTVTKGKEQMQQRIQSYTSAAENNKKEAEDLAVLSKSAQEALITAVAKEKPVSRDMQSAIKDSKESGIYLDGAKPAVTSTIVTPTNRDANKGVGRV